nr:MAG TPA: hypothetical protein [Caudoviricetes sp.]
MPFNNIAPDYFRSNFFSVYIQNPNLLSYSPTDSINHRIN